MQAQANETVARVRVEAEAELAASRGASEETLRRANEKAAARKREVSELRAEIAALRERLGAVEAGATLRRAAPAAGALGLSLAPPPAASPRAAGGFGFSSGMGGGGGGGGGGAAES
jgi:hypothetical protein